MKRKDITVRLQGASRQSIGAADAVEHVLPKSNDAVWHGYAKDDLQLGNFTLITKALRKDG